MVPFVKENKHTCERMWKNVNKKLYSKEKKEKKWQNQVGLTPKPMFLK